MTKKSTQPTGETRIIKGKHRLTDQELIDAGKELSDGMATKDEIMAQAKTEATKFKDKIEEQDKIIDKAIDKIRTGEEDRDYQCRVERDDEQKQKRYIDVESGKVIKTVPYSASDYQTELDTDEKQLAASTDENKG